MKVAIAGTGEMARTLGQAWVTSGHQVTIAGRNRVKAEQLARNIGASVSDLHDVADTGDIVVLAITWGGALSVLGALGASDGALSGKVVIDPINAVEHGIGRLLQLEASTAELIAGASPGASVVKALNIFPATYWQHEHTSVPTVAIAGDDPVALDAVGKLISDLGAQAETLGPLSRARQLEEVAGFVIGLSFKGIDPCFAVPGL